MLLTDFFCSVHAETQSRKEITLIYADKWCAFCDPGILSFRVPACSCFTQRRNVAKR